MTDADNDLFQHSDPSHLAALRITKAVVASGVTPEVLEASKDELARYVAGISAGAVDAWGVLGERQGALAEIEFAAQPQQ